MAKVDAAHMLPDWERVTHVAPAFRRLERRAADLAEHTLDRASNGVRVARRSARKLANDAADARDSAALYVRRHPLKALLVTSGTVLAAGMLAGWLVGNRRRRRA